MLRKGALAAGLMGTCCLAGTASADFVGWFFDSYATNVAGADYAVIDVYAQFDGTTDTVLNVFNSMISTVNGTAFRHNDFQTLSGQPGAWNVTQSGNIPGVVDASIDSFVLIGGPIGGANQTSLDPSFNPPSGGTVAENAGWFNSQPPSLQGRVDPTTLRTFVARFVIEGISSSESLSFAANGGYNQGLGTPAQNFYDGGQGSGPSFSVAFVPAPGAIALLGIAGLAGRRRRG